jgi:hypothetical protein
VSDRHESTVTSRDFDELGYLANQNSIVLVVRSYAKIRFDAPVHQRETLLTRAPNGSREQGDLR